MANKPNFMILGAQKAGTTWIANMLKHHPEIFIPEDKEIHFFNKSYNYKKGFEWYHSFFSTSGGAKMIGDATPNYLWTGTSQDENVESNRTQNIPQKIYDYNPDLKFIVSLRDPVSRAYSAYKSLIRGGHISPNTQITEVLDNRGIITMGYYEKHISNWFQYFPRDKFLFLIFEEDIKENREKTLQRLFNFLDVDSEFSPPDVDEVQHVSLGPIYRYLLYYFPFLRSVARTILPNFNTSSLPFNKLLDQDIDRDTYNIIRQYYIGQFDNLPELIGTKPSWLENYQK